MAANVALFRNCRRGGKELWDRVNDILGRKKTRRAPAHNHNISAEGLNDHYATISNDTGYIPPAMKATTVRLYSWLSEMEVFRMLDGCRPTATGLDGLPSWFLRVAAPFISAPLAYLFNVSISCSVVPIQWKVSVITPVPKVNQPTTHAEYRPISITPILSRLLEKFYVREFIYPVLSSTQYRHLFSDQFAFRPTGSTTAAIISLLSTVSHLLRSNSHVLIISLDFSKAFDTVRHATLSQKLADLPIPDNAYNWLINYLSQRGHVTKFDGVTSTVATINCSIVQGSGIGPGSYILNASDLHPVQSENQIVKFADDTYLIVPSTSAASIRREIENIKEWARDNNLKLNLGKCQEMVVCRHRSCQNTQDMVGLSGFTRVKSLKMLGVTFNDRLEFTGHVEELTRKAGQLSYALRVLKTHGLEGPRLWDVTRATAISRVTYAVQAWRGFLNVDSTNRLESVVRRLKKTGLLPSEAPTFTQLCDELDMRLFSTVLADPEHVLHDLLPPVKTSLRTLRPRPHSRQLPSKDNLLEKNFLIRRLYSDSY